MKRPVIVFTLFFAFGIIANIYDLFPNVLMEYKFFIIPLILIFTVFSKKKTIRIALVIMVGIIMGSAFFGAYYDRMVLPVSSLSGKTEEINAVVSEFPQVFDDSIRVGIKVINLNNKKLSRQFKTKVYLPVKYSYIKPGDKLSLKAEFYLAGIYDGFDKKTYYNSNGIYILARNVENEEITVQKAARIPLWGYPQAFSNRIKQSIFNVLPEREAGFLTSLLLGDKNELYDKDYLNLKKSGTAHIAAVSGMHIGFLVSFLLLAFGKKNGSIISIVLVIFLVFVAGFKPSIIRAAIIYIIFAMSFFLNRETDSLNSLAIALLFILVINPYSLFGASLQLSFGATLGILLFSEKIQSHVFQMKTDNKHLNRLIQYIKAAVVCSITAMIFTTPILMYHFGYFSLVSVISNILILFAVSILFVMGYICCVISMFFLPIGKILSIALIILIRYILFICEKISLLPFAVMFSDSKLCIIIIVISYIVLTILYFTQNKIKKRYSIMIVAVFFITVVICSTQMIRNERVISVLPSGTGQCIAVGIGGEKLCVIDCSANGKNRNAANNIEEWMTLRNYNKVNTLILTAIDKTHARNVCELLDKVEVDEIIIPRKVRSDELKTEILTKANQKDISIIYCDTNIVKDDFGINIDGTVSKKLVIDINTNEKNIFIAHSLTQKMLEQYLLCHKKTANTIVISSANTKDYNKLINAIKTINANRIIVNSGYTFATNISGIEVENTYQKGEILFVTY